MEKEFDKKIYFGGTIREEWTAEALKIHYDGALEICAAPAAGGGYLARAARAEDTDAADLAKALNAPPAPEDDGLLAMQRAYFQRAAALTYRESLSPRLREAYDFLYIPELLRQKLDENGAPWEDALAAVAARCSFIYVLPAAPVPFFLLAHTQPRVAKLVQVLSDDFSRRLAAFWPDKPRRCAELAIIRDDFLYPDALALAFCGQVSASWEAISGPLRPYYVFMPDKLKELL